MKIIFLDVDGVLCCNSMAALEADKLDLLRQVVEVTQAVVVLSSDWRRDFRLRRKVTEALEALNIRVLGITPVKRDCRPVEIMMWVREFRSHLVGADAATLLREDIDGYAAIDDRDLLGETGGDKLEDHFVRTDPDAGLDRDCRRQLIQILSLNRPVWPPPEALPAGRRRRAERRSPT